MIDAPSAAIVGKRLIEPQTYGGICSPPGHWLKYEFPFGLSNMQSSDQDRDFFGERPLNARAGAVFLTTDITGEEAGEFFSF
jgi:hypothetical protein